VTKAVPLVEGRDILGDKAVHLDEARVSPERGSVHPDEVRVSPEQAGLCLGWVPVRFRGGPGGLSEIDIPNQVSFRKTAPSSPYP
jgi:hypothetical protein